MPSMPKLGGLRTCPQNFEYLDLLTWNFRPFWLSKKPNNDDDETYTSN